MKKILSLILAIVLAFSCISVTAFAGGSVGLPAETEFDKLGDAQKIELFEKIYDSNGSLKKLLTEKFLNCEERVDLSSLNIKSTDMYGEVENIFVQYIREKIAFTNPLLFNLNFDIPGTTYTDKETGKIIEFAMPYRYDLEEYNTMKKVLELEANKFLTDIKGHSELTDVHKALILHDKLAINCKYASLSNGHYESVAYTAYGALVNGEAVCQGYSLAYMYLLDKVGIKSYFCPSDGMGHAWNIVEIGGKKYHVDVTHDDLVPDVYGRVSHNHFLKSSEALWEIQCEEKSVYDMEEPDYDTTPADTTYDDAFWNDSETEFQLIVDDEDNCHIYYINNNYEDIEDEDANGALMEWNLTGGADTLLCDVSDYWYARKNTTLNGNFARLSSDGLDLFYTSSTQIFKYDLLKNQSEVVYDPETQDMLRFSKASYNYIFGFTYDNGYKYEAHIFTDGNTKQDYEDLVPIENPYAEQTIEEIDGELVLVKNGQKVDKTGTIQFDGVNYFFEKGVLDTKRDKFVVYDKIAYHINHGVLDLKEGEMVVPCEVNKDEYEYFYIKGAKGDNNKNGIVEYNGDKWYIEGGKAVYTTEKALVKYDSKNYIIFEGKIVVNEKGIFKNKVDGSLWEVADNGTAVPHTRHVDADGKWNSDGTNHWHECPCGEKFDIATHTLKVKNKVDATCTTTGLTGDTYCSVCQKVTKKSEMVDFADHNYADKFSGICKKCGYIRYSGIKKIDGNYYYYVKGKLDTAKETWTIESGKLYCFKAGKLNTSYNGLVTLKSGAAYLVKKGIGTKHTHSYKTKTLSKASMTRDGVIVSSCDGCGDAIPKVVYYIKSVTLSATSYTYDGKVKKPTVKVKDRTGKTISSSNYTVSYASGRKNIGSYKVTVKFKGNYSGTKTLTFKINPKNPTVTVKSASKKATISYKKVSGGVKYEIQYSTKKSSGFKNVKTNTTALKVTKSGLTKGKTYYFRVRAYKKVGSTTYYSGWVTKSVKIK